jgi:argininosuccinate lyase
VKFCEKSGIELHQLTDAQLLTIHPALTKEVKEFLDLTGAVASRSSAMGTAQKSVATAINQLKKEISKADEAITSQRAHLSGIISQ